jgi:hypothetical protein
MRMSGWKGDGDGECIRRWRVHTAMESAYGDGECIRRWRVHTAMESAYGDGECMMSGVHDARGDKTHADVYDHVGTAFKSKSEG